MICGTETNDPVVLKNYGGEWRCVTTPQTQSATYDGSVLRGGPYDGMTLSELPANTLVYVTTESATAEETTASDADQQAVSSDVPNSGTSSVSETIDSAVNWALAIAADNTHGYSQSTRWGPSYDCSSLIISAWEQAGVPVKSKGATYTGNMLGVFLSCGFADVTHQVHLSDGSGIVKGDVLLNVRSHTVMSIGNGRVVAARSSNGTSDTADNSGTEITTQAYYNYSSGWDYVLRYMG